MSESPWQSSPHDAMPECYIPLAPEPDCPCQVDWQDDERVGCPACAASRLLGALWAVSPSPRGRTADFASGPASGPTDATRNKSHLRRLRSQFSN
jgi:hypothetical protein